MAEHEHTARLPRKRKPYKRKPGTWRPQGRVLTGRAWQPEEIAFLHKNYPAMSLVSIAQALNRGVRGVHHKVTNLGLRSKTRTARRFTREEIRRLRILSENHNINEIAAKLGRHRESVAEKMRELSIKPMNDCLGLKQIARETGYDVYQLHRARKALNQHWRRVPRGIHRKNAKNPTYQFAIRFEQMEALCEYLKNETQPPLKRDSRGQWIPRTT